MKQRILFVDDDQVLRHLLQRHFAGFAESFTVVMVGDGFAAVKMLEKSAFSLVVLDLVMPRMDGMSLLTHLLENFPDIPVVSISAMEADQLGEYTSAGNVVAHLTKPFEKAQLSSLISTVLKKEATGGTLHDVSPAIFLQLMEMDGKTCTIRVLDERSTQGGILYFIDGQLVDARIGALRGIEAAYRVFTWERVTIFLRNSCSPRENVIGSELQPIIMKAAGMRDEAEDALPGEEAISALLEEIELETGDQGGEYAVPERRTPAGTAAADDLSLAELRTLFEQRLMKGGCRLEELRIDKEAGPTLDLLARLGRLGGLGDFDIACLQHSGESGRFLLPEAITAEVRFAVECDRDRVIGALRGRGRP
jgi:CheY-like chemotaxis protein